VPTATPIMQPISTPASNATQCYNETAPTTMPSIGCITGPAVPTPTLAITAKPVPCIMPTPGVIERFNDTGGPWWLLILTLAAGALTLGISVHKRNR
jgi:hypothetical protein